MYLRGARRSTHHQRQCNGDVSWRVQDATGGVRRHASGGGRLRGTVELQAAVSQRIAKVTQNESRVHVQGAANGIVLTVPRGHDRPGQAHGRQVAARGAHGDGTQRDSSSTVCTASPTTWLLLPKRPLHRGAH